mgnify:CR=1 FL=1
MVYCRIYHPQHHRYGSDRSAGYSARSGRCLNGLILPITLGVCLVASKKKTIMGEDYHHPTWLLILGIIVVIISAYLGITSLGNLATLFA